MNGAGTGRVLAVLDDAAGAARVLDACCALAQALRRDVQLVFVESRAALAAAELSVTQVLASPGHAWAPLAAEDVERGWRVHAARLRELAAQASRLRAVRWSLRVTRGSLRETTLALLGEAGSDLLLVAAAPPLSARAPGRCVVVLDDGGPAGCQALAVATRLAEALPARLQVQRAGPGGLSLPSAAELVVAPRELLTPAQLAALRVPALLVGPAR